MFTFSYPPRVMQVKRLEPTPESAASILRALEVAIDERRAIDWPVSDLTARKLAILELVKLSERPSSPETAARRQALIDEFGSEDVERWLSFIEAK